MCEKLRFSHIKKCFFRIGLRRDNYLTLGQAFKDFYLVFVRDASFHIHAALSRAILHYGKLPAFE
jgi:hypothetical protein